MASQALGFLNWKRFSDSHLVGLGRGLLELNIDKGFFAKHSRKSAYNSYMTPPKQPLTIPPPGSGFRNPRIHKSMAAQVLYITMQKVGLLHSWISKRGSKVVFNPQLVEFVDENPGHTEG